MGSRGVVKYIAAPSQAKVKISEWRVAGNRAREVMRVIYPLLTKRRQNQVDAALAGETYLLKQKRNGEID